MNKFRVWIRPLHTTCRVRVAGLQNARWLLALLSQSFIFKSSEPIDDDAGASSATFLVPYSSQMPHLRFARLLGGIPQVELMPDPA